MRHAGWIAGCVAGLTLGSLGTAAASRLGGAASEPPLLFRIEANGTSMPLLADQPTELATPGEKTLVTLRVEPHRVFTLGGCTFHYPRHFAFEHTEHEPGFEQWALDGNNVICTVVRRQGDDLTSAELLDALVGAAAEAFAPNPVTRGKDAVEIEGRRRNGVRLDVQVGPARIRQSFFALDPKGGATLLILQDALEDDGSTSAEMKDLRARLKATFKLAP